MAYEIIGSIYKIGTTENITTRNNTTLQKRSLVLKQQRYDQNTGEPFEPNYLTIDFTQMGCAQLDKYKTGDFVRVRFDVSGVKYNDKNTQEEKFFVSLRGFRIEPYKRSTAQENEPASQPKSDVAPASTTQPEPEQGDPLPF